MTDQTIDLATNAEAIVACCNMVYGHPLAEKLVGESFHPGGLARTRELLQASGLQSGSRILDVGCGLGASSRLAATEFGLAVDAIDVSEAVLDHARTRSAGIDIRWQRGDVTSLTAADETYDAVLAECVLATAPREAAMTEIQRVLRPGGLLLLSDVQISGDPIEHLEPGGVLGTALCVASAWLPGEFERRVGSAGLEVSRRWNRGDDVLGLIERIAGRLTVARTLLPKSSPSDDALETTALPDAETVRAVTTALRSAVEDGRLGYFAAVARR
jgi:SAM-dependent methyltransferase